MDVNSDWDVEIHITYPMGESGYYTSVRANVNGEEIAFEYDDVEEVQDMAVRVMEEYQAITHTGKGGIRYAETADDDPSGA